MFGHLHRQAPARSPMASWRRLAPRTSAERAGVAPGSASVRVHVFMCVMFVVFVLEGAGEVRDVVKNPKRDRR